MQYPTIAQPQYGFAPTMPMMPSMSDMPPAMMAEGGLASAAQSVQSKGRGKDTMLVHMTPKEVGGLQALAMQNGGSLTINPQTGLPEAGFLENLLPTLIGAGLMMVPGLQGVGAGYIGAGVGAVETLRTGDIGKGLLAGLGAYGGANLTGGLMSAAGAAPTVSPTAGAAAMANPAAAPVAAPAVDAVTASATGAPPAVATTSSVTSPTSAGVSSPPKPTFTENLTQAGRGVQNIFTNPAEALPRFIGKAATSGDKDKGIEALKATGLGGGMGVAKTVGALAAPAVFAPPKYDVPDQEKEEPYEGPYTPIKRAVSYPGDERRRTSEFTYFTPSNPVPFAEGGETAGLSASSMTAPEAEVFSQIANVQRLAGLPAIDTSGFNILPSVDRAALVYSPIDNTYISPTSGSGGLAGAGERSYGFQSLSSDIEPGGMPSKFGGSQTDLLPFIPMQKAYNVDMTRYEYDPVLNGYKQRPIVDPYSSDEENFSSDIEPRGMPSKVEPAQTDSSFIPMQKAYNLDMTRYEYDPILNGYKLRTNVKPYQSAKGGSVPQLESGGFVLTKKAVDGLGRGSNERGQANAQRGLGAIPIRGRGTGTSDSIKTSIDGKRPALVSNGEAYVPKKQVAKKGGAKAFYALMKQAEKSADKRSRA